MRVALLKLHAQKSIFEVCLFLPYQFKSSELGGKKIKKKKIKEEMLLFLFRRCWSMLSARCSAGGPRRLAAPGEQRADACLKYCPLRWQLGRERREAGASCSSPSPLVVTMTSPEKSWQRAGKEALAAATQGGEPIVEEEGVEGREWGEDKGGEDVPAAARERDALPRSHHWHRARGVGEGLWRSCRVFKPSFEGLLSLPYGYYRNF